MTDPRAIEYARSALAHEFTRAEMEALDRTSAAVTADFVTLLAASMKAEGMDREPWAADLLAEAIEAGCNAKKSLRRRASVMGKDGAEYRRGGVRMTRTYWIDMGTTDMRRDEFLAYAEHMASKTRVWLDGDRLALMIELPEESE